MQKTRLETYYLIAFFLLGLFPVVPLNVKPFLLVPLLSTSLYSLFMANKKAIDLKKIVISTCLYFLFVISALYTSDTDRAIKLLIRLLPLLILPFSFALVPNTFFKKLTDIFIQVYIISCCLFCFIILIYCITLDSTDIYTIYSYLATQFLGYEDHPIYISLYLGIAIILVLAKNKRSALNIFFFLTFFSTLLFLSRKGNIIGLTIILLAMIVYNSKKILNRLFLGYTLLGLLIVVSVSYLFNNFLFIRFQEIFNVSQFLYDPESSTGIRSILWGTGLKLSVEAPFFGYGLGNVQDVIDANLIENGYEKLTLIYRYNAHNQYLQIVLISGYIGLIFFIGILSYIFKRIKHNKQSICVFLYIVFCFLFESLLERQNGIIITALFFNLFLFLPQEKEIVNEKLSEP